MDVRTFGTLRRTGHGSRPMWDMQAEPHVIIKAKRLLERSSPTVAGTLQVSDTPAIARELVWLLSRWRMRMSLPDLQHLGRQYQQTEQTEQTILQIQRGRRLGGEGWLEPAMAPYPYQLEAADVVLATGRNLVVHGIGLGKTFTSYLVLRNPAARPAVVATLGGTMPAQWCRQLAQFFPTLTSIIGPTGQLSDKKLGQILDADVVVLPYSRLDKYSPHLRGHARTAIFDEIQELRHSKSAKYIAAAAIAGAANYVVGATATPVYGYGGEIYEIVEVIEPGALGERSEFVREWSGRTVGMGRNVSVKHAGALGAYLREQGLMDVKSAEDAGRPAYEPNIIEYPIDVDSDIINVAERGVLGLAEKLLSEEGSTQERFGWQQDMDWRMREATGLAKAPHVANLIRLLLDAEDRVLLFGWHHRVYDMWTEELAEFEPVLFTGRETPRQKLDGLDRFTNGTARVCLMSLRAGAGLDGLQQNCAVAVIGELDWVPGVHKQNFGRLARPGQSRVVTGYICTTDQGADPLMTEALGMKQQEADRFIEPPTGLLATVPMMSNRDRIRSLARSIVDRHGPTHGKGR